MTYFGEVTPAATNSSSVTGTSNSGTSADGETD